MIQMVNEIQKDGNIEKYVNVQMFSARRSLNGELNIFQKYLSTPCSLYQHFIVIVWNNSASMIAVF